MKDYPRLLCLRMYSDLKRKELFTLLYSNRVCTIGLENGETSCRNREYGCHIIGDHERRWPLTWTLIQGQCYGSVQG